MSLSKTHQLPTVLVKTTDAMASSRHDRKIDDWDVKPEYKLINFRNQNAYNSVINDEKPKIRIFIILFGT